MADEKQATRQDDKPDDPVQKAHTVLWSAYVGLSDYDAERFADRYKLRGVERIATDLIRFSEKLVDEPDRELDGPITNGLLKLGLWYFQPQFTRLPAEQAQSLLEVFAEIFGVDPAAFPTDGPDRPAVPPLPEHGIQDSRLTTTRFRRTTRVRLECNVLHPYLTIRPIVYPWNWGRCPFWTAVPTAQHVGDFWSDERLSASVQLPGGWLLEATKQRWIQMHAEAVRSPFQTRLDYEAREVEEIALWGALSLAEIRKRGGRPADSQDVRLDERVEPNSSRRRVEVRAFSGSLLVEKLAGQPGACRVVLEREGSFGHPSHEYFSEEVFGYWITSELVTFVEAALRSQKEGSVGEHEKVA